MISKPYMVGKISYIGHYVPSNSPNDSIMYPVNVKIVYVEDAAMMAFVSIPMGALLSLAHRLTVCAWLYPVWPDRRVT